MFKKELTKKIQAWCLENPGKSINKYEVVEIAFPGMVTSLSNKAIIKEGFRVTGTYPWDPSQVSFSRMAASSVFASEEQIRPPDTDTDDGQLLVDHVPVLGEGRDTATATAASTAFRELFPSTSTSAETSIFPGSISDTTLELPVPESSPTLAVTSEVYAPVPSISTPMTSVSASVTNEVSAPAPVSSVSSPAPVTSDVSAPVTTDSAPVMAHQSVTVSSNTPDLQFTPIRSLEDRKRRYIYIRLGVDKVKLWN